MLTNPAKKISRYFLLFLLNFLIFSIFYFSNIFDAIVFKSVSKALSLVPSPAFIRSFLIVTWMIIPQTLALFAFNQWFSKIPTKKFMLLQSLFAIIIVLLLEMLIRTAGR